jgi:hypothetical protein
VVREWTVSVWDCRPCCSPEQFTELMQIEATMSLFSSSYLMHKPTDGPPKVVPGQKSASRRCAFDLPEARLWTNFRSADNPGVCGFALPQLAHRECSTTTPDSLKRLNDAVDGNLIPVPAASEASPTRAAEICYHADQ